MGIKIKMKAKNYCKKNGFIYGVSSKFEFGRWNYCFYKFTEYESALKWLDTEEYNFRERELMSKSKFVKYFGKKALNKVWEVTESGVLI